MDETLIFDDWKESDMRLSLRFKINFFIALVMVVTASAILWISHRDMVDAIFEAEESSAKNVLRLVELNIKGGYQRLLADRVDTLNQRKARLKNLASTALSVLKDFSSPGAEGVPESESARKALDWIKNSVFGTEYAFVFDNKGLVLSHPDPSIEGFSLAGLKDMKGRDIVDAMNVSAIGPEGSSAVLRWELSSMDPDMSDRKQLGYFLPFPEAGWTVGAVVDIGDIETNAQKQLDNMTEALRETFGDIRVTASGSVFVFDGRKRLLVPPAAYKAENFADTKNLHTGKGFLDDLMEACLREEKSVSYVARLGSGLPTETGKAFVGYFKSLDWYIAVLLPEQEIQGPAKQLMLLQSVFIALIFLLSIIASFLLVSRITRPMNLLADYAKDIPSQDFTVAETQASPIDGLPAKYRDEVGRLAASLLFMRDELRKNIQDLMKTTAAKERIESELNIAREIQMGMLPKIFPPFPEIEELDLHAVLTPAKEVGGDLYDFFFLDDHRLCFAIGDVSDKGVPAALFMVITRTLINIVAKQEQSPAKMMTRVNDVLCIDNPRQMFVTLLIGVIDIRTGRITYANGGHNPPVLVGKNSGASVRKGISGPLLGVMEDIEYKDMPITLEAGDAFFLYTDGVTEAMNASQELYSEKRLLERIADNGNGKAEEVIAAVMKDVGVHAGDAPQSDDVTMMMIRYRGNRRTVQ